MSDKRYIKQKILEFYEQHPNFDDRRLGDILDAERLSASLAGFPRELIIEAVEELRGEVDKEVDVARSKFYRKIEEVNRGKHNATIESGVHGEVRGSSERRVRPHIRRNEQ